MKNMLHPEQKRIYQNMSPEQKLMIALSLYDSAQKLKAAALRAQNADWSENRIWKEVKEIFLYART